jgi:hypothetical protein
MARLRTGSLAATVVLLATAAPAHATHLGTGNPDCVNAVPAAGAASYDAGRVRVLGYASGTVGAINLRAIDSATPPPVPDVFKPAAGPPVATDAQVAGALVSLSFPGLPNTFLLGGSPFTQVKESAFPLDLSATKTHAGAQTLSMLFNGRVRIWQPESFRCESTQGNTLWTVTIPKVSLDGYATAPTGADDADLEPWGTGLDISLAPGDTSGL